MRCSVGIVTACLGVAVMQAPLCAQMRENDNRDAADAGPLRPLRIAKWSTLAAAGGATAWGFILNSRADTRFAEIGRRCERAPERCARRGVNGAYGDPELDRLYRDAKSFDDDAYRALLLGQVGVGVSVVLFLLDLGNASRPPDIPFVPTALSLELDPMDGLVFTMALPVGGQARPAPADPGFRR